MTTSKSSPAYTAKPTQTAIVQSDAAVPGSTEARTGPLPLAISHAVPVPSLPPPPGHLRIRVLAVALNPNDFKMPTYLPDPGATAGCDYCGLVLATSSSATDADCPYKEGDRVCGSLFAYNPARPRDGSFAQFALVDARLALRVPADWTDAHGAAMGGIGWTTAALALWGGDALALPARPSRPLPEARSEPVLVYGGATASGTMASQILKLSGYRPIAVASPASAALARQYGAAGTASYQSASVAEDARQAATATGAGGQIRHALDCITDAESYAACMGAIARRGGRYASLEVPEAGWAGARKAVKACVVMAYECTGHAVDYGGGSAYTRAASPEAYALAVEAVAELQPLVDDGRVVPHPVRELRGGWEGILKGLEMLRGGQVRGEKLVVRIPQAL